MSTHIQVRALQSNGIPLAREGQEIGRLVPTDPRRPMEELREQFRVQGYLWLKGLLPRDEVLNFRRHYFTAYRDTGLLAEGSDPIEGIYSGIPIAPELNNRLWTEAARWPEYEAFCLSPAIVNFYEAFLAGAVHLLKRKIIRYNTPGETSCTPGHYDLIYLRGGSDTVCSSWIPFSDTPVAMGGLVYLEGSDALGRRLEAEFSAKNVALSPEERISAYNKNMAAGGWIGKDLPALADLLGGRWLVADYEAGDMVVHSCYMIHAATQNSDPRGRMRLSTDIRYQRSSDAIDPRWNNDLFIGDNL